MVLKPNIRRSSQHQDKCTKMQLAPDKFTKLQLAPDERLLSTLETIALSLVSLVNALLGVDSGIGASGKFECPEIRSIQAFLDKLGEAMDREVLWGEVKSKRPKTMFIALVYSIGSNLNKELFTLYTIKNSFCYFSWPRFCLRPLLPRLYRFRMLH